MATSTPTPNPNLSSFIWSVADLLRGDYKPADYGKVILPFTVLRRLDCVLESTKAAVLAEKATREAAGLNPEPFLLRKSGQFFYNTLPLNIKKLMGDQDHIGENLCAYLQAFSPAVRDIFESSEFHVQIEKLAKAGLLYMVTEKFATIVVSGANDYEVTQLGQVLQAIIVKRRSPTTRRSKHLGADAGYRGRRAFEIMEAHGYFPHVVRGHTQANPQAARSSQESAALDG